MSNPEKSIVVAELKEQLESLDTKDQRSNEEGWDEESSDEDFMHKFNEIQKEVWGECSYSPPVWFGTPKVILVLLEQKEKSNEDMVETEQFVKNLVVQIELKNFWLIDARLHRKTKKGASAVAQSSKEKATSKRWVVDIIKEFEPSAVFIVHMVHNEIGDIEGAIYVSHPSRASGKRNEFVKDFLNGLREKSLITKEQADLRVNALLWNTKTEWFDLFRQWIEENINPGSDMNAKDALSAARKHASPLKDQAITDYTNKFKQWYETQFNGEKTFQLVSYAPKPMKIKRFGEKKETNPAKEL